MFLAELNRGGLWAPQEHTSQLCILCWRIFSENKNTTLRFLDASYQSGIFCDVIDIATGEQFDLT